MWCIGLCVIFLLAINNEKRPRDATRSRGLPKPAMGNNRRRSYFASNLLAFFAPVNVPLRSRKGGSEKPIAIGMCQVTQIY